MRLFAAYGVPDTYAYTYGFQCSCIGDDDLSFGEIQSRLSPRFTFTTLRFYSVLLASLLPSERCSQPRIIGPYAKFRFVNFICIDDDASSACSN